MNRRTSKSKIRSRDRSRPLFVAIVGGSGSGKTWLAKKLFTALNPDAARLSQDDFYNDHSHLQPEHRAKVNFDHPSAIDWAVMERTLKDLRAGRQARLPVYDFKTHCRCENENILAPRPVLLVDGLWLLRRRSMRKVFGLKIYIDCPVRTRRNRRLSRDMRSRGRTRAAIIEQLRETVEPMHERFVAPQAKWADVILRHDFGEPEIRRLTQQLREQLAASHRAYKESGA